MVSYQYEAMRITDRAKEAGVIEAKSEREARERLREQDLIPTHLRLVTAVTEEEVGKVRLLRQLVQQALGIRITDKIAFSRNLGMMAKAGIPLSEALRYLENYSRNAKFKKVLGQIRMDIVGGSSFSQALAQHPRVFNDVYVNVVHAGEVSGELVAAMNRMTVLLEKAQKLQMKVVTTSVYPIIVLAIVLVVLGIMTFFVLPTFEEIYDRMGVTLPWITSGLIWMSGYLRQDGWIVLLALGAFVFSVVKYVQSPTGKTMLDYYALKTPVVAELVNLVNVSHFISTLSVAFGAGIPVVDALTLAAQTVRHTQMKKALAEVNAKIQTGQRLALALSETGYLPDIVLLMVASGEESGQLDVMLDSSYEYVESELNHRIDILTAMMEPIMLVLLGLIVGFLALAIYLPMFKLYENL